MQLIDPVFIAGYLPAVLLGFYLLGRVSPRAAVGFLTTASLVFYAWSGIEGAVLLVCASAGNYLVARWMLRTESDRRRKAAVWLGVTANVALLGYFKYSGFLLGNLAAVAGGAWRVPDIVLPLGISFSTFQRIAVLVDVYRGRVKELPLLDYALFSGFFPCADCGPITRAQEMLPQFRAATARFASKGFAEGLSLFVVGLFKKVVIADTMQVATGLVFNQYADGPGADVVMTWVGVVAYSLEIYYDFSGYSEMALGLAKMLGLRLPCNFNAPYKANSIIGFWNRWHMTLSRFLRDYLFATLARGSYLPKRYAGLLATMLIAGLWHGANWTFVVWGGLHGLFLVVNHAWRSLAERFPDQTAPFTSKRAKPYGRLLTFVAVSVAWIFFRSADLTTAGAMCAGLVGIGNPRLAFGSGWLLDSIIPLTTVPVLLIFTFKAPHTIAIFSKAEPCIENMPVIRTRWRWAPTWKAAAVIGLLAFLAFRAYFNAHEVGGFSYANF